QSAPVCSRHSTTRRPSTFPSFLAATVTASASTTSPPPAPPSRPTYNSLRFHRPPPSGKNTLRGRASLPPPNLSLPKIIIPTAPAAPHATTSRSLSIAR